ncbi:hypothetical protein N8488_01200 [Akkermansiaceae bacterium]|nr:hypothetical protein [Akkermansiaceae bacterium]
MSQRISTTVLQRVIVLVFPLLVVCFFGLDVARNKRGSTPKDAGLDLRKVRSAESSVAWQRGGKGRDNVSPITSLINRSDHSRLPYQKPENTAVPEASFHSLYPDLLSQLCEQERRQLEGYLVHLESAKRMDQPWLCWDEGVQRAKLELYHQVEKLTGLSGGGI